MEVRTIEDLKPGMLFKTKKQRKYRVFEKKFLLIGKGVQSEDIGKWLVIYSNCKQSVFDPLTEVEVLNDLTNASDHPAIR